MNFANLFMNINPKEVLTNLPDAVFVVDSDGKIVWANDKASYIFEIDKRAINGCLFNDLVPDGMLSASKSSSKKAAIITGAFVGDNSEIYIELNAKKLGEQYFITVRDITAMTNILTDAEQKGKLNKNKNLMLLKLSNDFKSPVQSIIGFSQALLDGLGGEINDKQNKYIKIINKNSNELLYFLEKFFDFSQAESAIYKYNYQTFDIVNTIQNIIRNNEEFIQQKNLEVQICTENLNKRAIYSDEEAIKTALENVIEVILKQTETASIVINISTIKPDEVTHKNIEKLKSNSHIKISVSHTGMGLAESEIEGIFEPYLQLGKNSKKMLNRSIILGTSALIVKQLKGSIWVESEVMKGSTFNIILPVEKENENTNE